MYRRMLVPLDGTRASAAIVPYAVELAARLGCRVDVVLVQPHEGTRLPHPEHHTRRRRDDGAVTSPMDAAVANQSYLQRYDAEFEARGLETATHLRTGDPVEEILRTALDCRSDVIAMATLNRARYANRDGVSVARKLLWRSRLRVMLLAEG